MPGIVEAVLASGLAEDDHAGLDQVGDLHGSPGEDDTGQALVEIAADLSLLVNDHADGATEAQVKLPYRLGPWPKLHADLAAVQGYRGGIRFAAGPGPREGIDFDFRAAAELQPGARIQTQCEPAGAAGGEPVIDANIVAGKQHGVAFAALHQYRRLQCLDGNRGRGEYSGSPGHAAKQDQAGC